MHFFVQLYRQNNQSENSKVFSAFESSMTAFDNIFGIIIFFLIITVLLKFQNFILRPEVCKSGRNFRLQKGLNLLCRICLTVMEIRMRTANMVYWSVRMVNSSPNAYPVHIKI